MPDAWQEIGAVEAAGLKASRVQLHSAAQLVGAVGKALASPQPDDSHSSLEWDSKKNAFVGVKISRPPAQAMLEVLALTLAVIETGDGKVRKLELSGHTLGEGFDWLRAALKEQGAEHERLDTMGDRSQLPEGLFGPQDRFDGSARAGFSEWARHYGNARLMLQEVKAARPAFSAVRVWPHHFDIASLYALPQGKGEPRTIGAGLSPGDGSYDEPYWYVTPWPYPEVKNLAALDGGGSWHTQDWVGAVLPASRLPRGGGQGQARQVRSFLQSAIGICERVLERN